MSNLVAKVEALLLQESFDTLCGTSVVYLTIEDNILIYIKSMLSISIY